MTSLLSSWSRLAACGLALVLVALFVCQFGREPMAKLAADWRERQHWQQILTQAQARADEIQVALSRSLPRTTIKVRLANDMIAGRIGVREAARQYAAVPGMPANFWAELREAEQGATDHERLCRHLIDYACSSLKSESASQAARRRLTAELETSLQQQAEQQP